ncbi:hypothetical protein GCM10025777_36890 [Membranihabitans marinus]|uniref:Uncharacterized protein n=1 Tax=Nesterenkonia rhizosphaerae TaxID=1348272 RepID=A0ABP9G160_9MICC
MPTLEPQAPQVATPERSEADELVPRAGKPRHGNDVARTPAERTHGSLTSRLHSAGKVLPAFTPKESRGIAEYQRRWSPHPGAAVVGIVGTLQNLIE